MASEIMKKEFIQKATKKHGDKYNYSKVEYINAKTKVTIICNKHKEFKLTPNKHLSRGDGCKKCGREKSSEKQRMTKEEFIEKSKLIHINENGNPIYDYEKVEYINCKTKVTIICNKPKHGEFQQIPSNHLTGYGCIKCRNANSGNSQRLTTKEFIEKSKLIHINENGIPIYGYEKVDYINSHTDVIIYCKTHGDFYQRPNNHLNGATCLDCSNEKSSEIQRMTTEEFIKKAEELHGYDKYNYSQTIYGINGNESVNIICNQHGPFEQTPSNHLVGKGCIKCGNEKSSERQRMSLEDCINKFKHFHGEKYDYSMVDYVNYQTNIKIKCIDHDILFYQTPSNHFRSTGCMKCHKHGYSNKAVLWLNFISKMYNINIQHAENDKEYTILNTKMRADGYCKENNTIYEFHGDFWHGNINKYASSDINIITKKSFGELYNKTLERENKIKELGYNLIVMWENDWVNINKNIKKIQQNYRRLKCKKV